MPPLSRAFAWWCRHLCIFSSDIIIYMFRVRFRGERYSVSVLLFFFAYDIFSWYKEAMILYMRWYAPARFAGGATAFLFFIYDIWYFASRYYRLPAAWYAADIAAACFCFSLFTFPFHYIHDMRPLFQDDIFFIYGVIMIYACCLPRHAHRLLHIFWWWWRYAALLYYFHIWCAPLFSLFIWCRHYYFSPPLLPFSLFIFAILFFHAFLFDMRRWYFHATYYYYFSLLSVHMI